MKKILDPEYRKKLIDALYNKNLNKYKDLLEGIKNQCGEQRYFTWQNRILRVSVHEIECNYYKELVKESVGILTSLLNFVKSEKFEKFEDIKWGYFKVEGGIECDHFFIPENDNTDTGIYEVLQELASLKESMKYGEQEVETLNEVYNRSKKHNKNNK